MPGGGFVRVKLLRYEPDFEHTDAYWNNEEGFVVVKIKDAVPGTGHATGCSRHDIYVYMMHANQN